MKLCKDCKHLAANTNFRFADDICVKGSEVNGAFEVSVVDGKTYINYDYTMYAKSTRSYTSWCGKDANWFEQRDPTRLEKLIGRFKQ